MKIGRRNKAKKAAIVREEPRQDVHQLQRELDDRANEMRAKLEELRAEIDKWEARPRIDHLFVGTANFAETWKFWTEIVGLEGKTKWGSPEYGGTVELGGPTITFAQGEEGLYEELGYTVENGRPVVYIHVKNVDEYHAEVVKRGATVVRPPVTTHFGARCFSVKGPDGMVIVFTQAK